MIEAMALFAQFQADALALTFLLDECEIYPAWNRAAPTTDRATWADTFTKGDQVYTGCCAAEPLASSRPDDIGQGTGQLSEIAIDVPCDATGIKAGMVVTLTKSEDPDLLGVPLRVLRAESDGLLRRLVTTRIEAFPTTG